MAGSKTLVPLDLVYNTLDDTAGWYIRSVARTLENARSDLEIITEDMPNYEAVAKLAGPKPEKLIEEVSQPTQGVNNE